MATSLIGGLLSSTQPDQILVAEPDANKCSELEEQFGIRTSDNNAEAINCDVVVLAVKPQLLQNVCRQLGNSINKNQPLFISIAAGVRSSDINRWLGGKNAIANRGYRFIG